MRMDAHDLFNLESSIFRARISLKSNPKTHQNQTNAFPSPPCRTSAMFSVSGGASWSALESSRRWRTPVFSEFRCALNPSLSIRPLLYRLYNFSSTRREVLTGTVSITPFPYRCFAVLILDSFEGNLTEHRTWQGSGSGSIMALSKWFARCAADLFDLKWYRQDLDWDMTRYLEGALNMKTHQIKAPTRCLEVLQNVGEEGKTTRDIRGCLLRGFHIILWWDLMNKQEPSTHGQTN